MTSVNADLRVSNQRLVHIRSVALQTVRKILESQEFVEVTTPEITSATGACENTDTLFTLDYFGKTGFLAQTKQLDLEYLVVRDDVPKVYTVGKSFRAEPRVDDRHLTEFTLIEIEAKDYTLEDLISLQEFIVWECWRAVYPHTAYPWDNEPFPVMTYTDVCAILDIPWGTDLNAQNEQEIVKYCGNSPVHVTHYPESISFFNMLRDRDSDVNKLTVAKCDMLLPHSGETFGGSVREYDYQIMKNKLLTSPMYHQLLSAGGDPKSFDQYLELFRDNPVHRAGFGLGFERLVQWIIQSGDVRDSDVFPMNRESI